MLSQAGKPVLDEIMHAFYFSYFVLIIGGIVIAWTRSRGAPGRAFHTAMTCMMLGFFLSYVWYPFLPHGVLGTPLRSWRGCVHLAAGYSPAPSN
jgi:hypothetical protein